ncbi:hypothetical protein ACFVJ4_37435 [Streptomyces sp. NPDC127178]
MLTNSDSLTATCEVKGVDGKPAPKDVECTVKDSGTLWPTVEIQHQSG